MHHSIFQILFLTLTCSYLFFESDAFINRHVRLKPRSFSMSNFQESSTDNTLSTSSSDGVGPKFKGFGKKEVPPPKPIEKTEKEREEEMKLESEIRSTNMFKNMRARQEESLDSKITKLREEEELIASDPSVGAVPEIVANRMLSRMIAFFGIPVFGGLGIFVAAFFYSKKYNVVVPPSIVAYATQVPFVLGLVGITYAILSSSWDVETQGTALGFNEAKVNFQRIKDGINRTRETAELKEQIETEKNKLGRK